MKYTVIALNQCTVHPSFKEIDDASVSTWPKENNKKDLLILNYYGGYNLDGTPNSKFKEVPEKGGALVYEENGVNYLILGCTDVIDSKGFDPRGLKQILAFEYVLNNYDFKLIYRTGDSAYTDLKWLYWWSTILPREDVFTGFANAILVDYTKKNDNPTREELYKFVVGCCMFMSKDIVEITVANKERYKKLTDGSIFPMHATEDLALGRLLTNELKLEALRWEAQPSFPPPANWKSYTETTELNLLDHTVTYRFDKGNTKSYLRLHEIIKERGI